MNSTMVKFKVNRSNLDINDFLLQTLTDDLLFVEKKNMK